ncbi:MAG: hypothetical protein NDJ89_04920 [Oligoflexia bacterium]|nr:hypothetical protein [Oligoflexia bacterium]
MTSQADFQAPPANLERVFELIARSPFGVGILERFQPLYQGGKVMIRPYPLEIVAKLREAIGPDQPIGASFVVDEDGKTGTIYADLGSPLGILAPFLLHEMVHALDRGIWKAARRPQTRKERDETMLLAETDAFGAQHRLIEELCVRVNGYREFIAAQSQRARILHERLTAEDIATLYGFKIA